MLVFPVIFGQISKGALGPIFFLTYANSFSKIKSMHIYKCVFTCNANTYEVLSGSLKTLHFVAIFFLHL